MTDRPPPRPQPQAGPWTGLRSLTAARIGLDRSGASLSTAPLLEFRLAHARARDAVHEPLDAPRLVSDLIQSAGESIVVGSAAASREQYLMRPDLGRTLSPEAATVLAQHTGAYDLSLIVADGLSARAVQMHAPPVIAATVSTLRREGWRIAPLVVVQNGRVAIGDAIAGILGAACVAVLIGERPGLSAPDSMGAYLTWQPGERTTDAERNCISNIRPDGIGYEDAAHKIAHLLRAMRARRVSGVQLKDDSELPAIGVSIAAELKSGSAP